MHLAKRILIVFLLATFSTISFAKEGRLTKIQKHSCLMFPKMLEIEKQVAGIHYEASRDSTSGCDTDINGNIEYDTCSDRTFVNFNYRYKIITIYDHFNSDGKLITTSTENVSLEITGFEGGYSAGEWTYTPNYSPLDATAKEFLKNVFDAAKVSMEAKIAKELYVADVLACDDSFYK